MFSGPSSTPGQTGATGYQGSAASPFPSRLVVSPGAEGECGTTGASGQTQGPVGIQSAGGPVGPDGPPGKHCMSVLTFQLL